MFDRLIVGSMIPLWPLLDSSERRQVAQDVTAYVVKALSGAPFHIRVGVTVLSAFIGGVALLMCSGTGGPLIRAMRIDGFYEVLKHLPGPAWPVIRLYRSMTLLAFYDHPLVYGKLAGGASLQHGKSAR